MTQWASYAITAVRYSPDHSRITDVEVRVDHGESIGHAMEWERENVVHHIDRGFTFVTAYLRNSNWVRGADLHVVVSGNERFIRTDQNRVRSDNLGELPEIPARPSARW
jgi:hypothetical protein